MGGEHEEPTALGLNNFDALQFAVVRDENLAFEMFKKGELDVYQVPCARQWVEELNFDNVQRGLIQKRKVFNDNPQGTQGFAFNTKKPPFDDVRVREALALLMNRQQIIQKIMFNEDLADEFILPSLALREPRQSQKRL